MIIRGDCLEEMKKMSDNSVDAIITDPPYDLISMTKPRTDPIAVEGNDGKGNPFCRKQASKGFMGKEWDGTGIAFKVELWKECLRVLKPGGHLISFGGTRTYHRMAVAIEDAGFEVRDMLEWIYASGFPKSLNVGKGVDKYKRRDFVLTAKELGLLPKDANRSFIDWTKEEHTPSNKYWEEFKRLIPKEDWEKIEREVIGKGQAGFLEKNNVFELDNKGYGNFNLTKGTSVWEGFGTALKPAHEPIIMARKPLECKTIVENVLKYGTGAIDIDGCRIPTSEDLKCPFEGKMNFTKEGCYDGGTTSGNFIRHYEQNTQGRFPANIICTDDALNDGEMTKSGNMNGVYKNTLMANKAGTRDGKEIHLQQVGDSGSKSRYFDIDVWAEKHGLLQFPKASKSERNEGCEGLEEKQKWNKGGVGTGISARENIVSRNIHPTVKPVHLMAWLVRLVSKEGDVVLDPFVGSGTTGVACMKLNRKFIGIEKEEEYCKIAEARIKPYLAQQKLEDK